MNFKALVALTIALCTFASGPAQAQSNYPTKPVRLIVPFPPGGGSDPVARVVAKGLSERLGQQVFIDNRPGAQGAVGTAAAAKSAPDGYTLLLFVGALVADPLVSKAPSFDPLKDLTFVTQVTSQPSLAVVGPHVQAANLREFVAALKAKPRSHSFGYGSVSGHLTGALLMQLTDTQMLAVPYKGAAPIMTDLVGGNVDLAFASPPSSIPLIKAGKLRGLAVVGPSRIPGLDVPTTAEAGLPDFVVDAWYAIAAPAGTPAPIVARLNAEVREVMRSPEAQEVLRAAGMEAKTNTPQEMANYVASEYKRWAGIVKTSGIKAE